MMDLHMRMLQDSVVRRRVMADSGMRRMVQEVMSDMPPEHRRQMQDMMRVDPDERLNRPTGTPAPTRPVRPERAPADTSSHHHLGPAAGASHR